MVGLPLSNQCFGSLKSQRSIAPSESEQPTVLALFEMAPEQSAAKGQSCCFDLPRGCESLLVLLCWSP